MKIFASIILALHGLIHLLGVASYMKLTEVQGLLSLDSGIQTTRVKAR